MFAVISHKGNQYKVFPNESYKIDLIDEPKDRKITFSEVLLVNNDGKVLVGNPLVEGAKVEAEFQENVSDDKVLVFKFKSKKRYKRTQGHRQDYSVIKVLDIKLKNEK